MWMVLNCRDLCEGQTCARRYVGSGGARKIERAMCEWPISRLGKTIQSFGISEHGVVKVQWVLLLNPLNLQWRSQAPRAGTNKSRQILVLYRATCDLCSICSTAIQHALKG